MNKDYDNTPLQQHRNTYGDEATKKLIDDQMKTAELIVKAVNCHQELITALKDSLQIMEQTFAYRETHNIKIGNIFLISAIAEAKAALKKAE